MDLEKDLRDCKMVIERGKAEDYYNGVDKHNDELAFEQVIYV